MDSIFDSPYTRTSSRSFVPFRQHRTADLKQLETLHTEKPVRPSESETTTELGCAKETRSDFAEFFALPSQTSPERWSSWLGVGGKMANILVVCIAIQRSLARLSNNTGSRAMRSFHHTFI
jgi:hypothetical protein